jgi:PAS domain S-box-containing protein
MLVAFVIIPKLNQFSDKEQAINLQEEIAIEIDLFKRFVEAKKEDLEALTKLPKIQDALSSEQTINTDFPEYFANLDVEGGQAVIVLQDMSGEVRLQTNASLSGDYDIKSDDVQKLISKDIDYRFDLIDQKEKKFRFQLSVPVKTGNVIKGILTAEINVPKSLAFISPSYDSNIAIHLLQKGKKVYTNFEDIKFPIEVSKNIKDPDLKFTYILNDKIAIEQSRNTQNITLSIIFLGLITSFVFFGLFGYLTYGNDQESKNSEKQDTWKSYGLPIIIGIIGLTATMTTYLIYKSVQSASHYNELENGAKVKIQLVKSKIDESLKILETTKAYLETTNVANQEAFEKFSNPLIEKRSYINEINWIPNIANYSNSTFHSFVIEQAQLSAIEKARDKGQTTAVLESKSTAKNPSRLDYLIFAPVYNDARDYNTKEERRGNSKGVIVLSVNTQEFFSKDNANKNLDIDFLVRDLFDVKNPQIILDETNFNETNNSAKVVYKTTAAIADKTWEIIAYSNYKTAFHWAEILILATGFGISSLVVMSLTSLISRRKTLEDTVKKRTAELRMANDLISNSNDMFVITEAKETDLDKAWPNIIYVNEAFTTTTGYTKEEALQSTPKILRGQNTDNRELKKIKQQLQGGESYSGEIINYNKNGQEYWANVSIWPLKDENGDTIHFGSVARDITDKKEFEKERDKLIDRLVDSNDSLERFAFVCSHDMQEPLRMIRSFSELLQEHLSKTLEQDEQGQKYFHFIVDGATRAQTLIQDILDYSSLDSDMQSSEEVDTLELVKLIEESITANEEAQTNKITYDDLPTVNGNKTQLYQLFQNLINNGIKYQQPNSDPHVHISAKEAGKFWEFCIQDNGIGIEEAHLSKVFEVFRRLHSKSTYSGTGIGLSICKKIVGRHGGNIWVESKEGQGSQFYFTLVKKS